MKAEHNYYKILGVNEEASSLELRKAFCKLTKELHPDTTSLNQDDASLKLQEVLEAYENLHNPTLRNLYDMKLKNTHNNKIAERNDFELSSNNRKGSYVVGQRRPFSNGEMFSLLLLVLVISLSLILFFIFATFAGREVNSIPMWLIK